jgi:hypothetical protein
MIIRLKRTYYHYCKMPKTTWTAFKKADSFGRHYHPHIKARYDCRLGGVPTYRK